MTILDVILNINELNEETVIYAKKINAKFQSDSEVVLLDLSEEDIELQIKEISEKYCPGFDYFLEVDIVKEIIEDIRIVPEYSQIEQQVNRIIYYAEHDA